MMDDEPVLEVERLSVAYLTGRGAVPAVDEVSLTIAPGEIVGLAGESGCGKSTLIRSILRVLPAPGAIIGGDVRIAGQDVLAMSERELQRLRWREVSWVSQSAMSSLNPVMTIGAQIEDVIEAHEGRNAKATTRAGELLDLVGVGARRLSAYPHELSGGQRQRVGIALALALSPRLIIMDEPTTALDVVVQKAILQRVVALQQERGFSVLFITHDLSLMLQLCARVGILYAGRLVEMGPASQIARAPQHPYTRGLLGSRLAHDSSGGSPRPIPGTPPDLLHLPPGCAFAPRCDRAVDDCRRSVPRLPTTAAEHRVACPVVS
ncbi:MAG: ABC transporter ATP-binding protein [Myxococcota bacterium]